MSEINVTPFVDVMLVLLIIFMITAPLMQTGVEIELPEVNTPNISENEDPLIISINKNNEIFLSEKKILSKNLNAKLIAIRNANPKVKVFIKADKVVPYETLMKVMKKIIDSNITNVSLITDPENWGNLIKFVTFSLIFHISLIAVFKIKNFSKENNVTKVINVSYVEKKQEKKKVEKKQEKKKIKKSENKDALKNKKQKPKSEKNNKIKKQEKKTTPKKDRNKTVQTKKNQQYENSKKFDDMLKNLAEEELEQNENINIENKIKNLSKKDLSNKNNKNNKKEIDAIIKLLMDQINDNWIRPPALKGYKNLVIKIDIYLDPNGNVYEIFIPSITKKQVENNTYLKPLLDSAVRAIKKSSPF